MMTGGLETLVTQDSAVLRPWSLEYRRHKCVVTSEARVGSVKT